MSTSLLAALYGLPAAAEAAGMIDVADSVHAALSDLSNDPTLEQTERAFVVLDGAQRCVLRLREAILRERGEHAC